MFKMKQSVAAAIVVCNYSAWKVEEGGWRTQDQPPIHSEFKVSWPQNGWVDGWMDRGQVIVRLMVPAAHLQRKQQALFTPHGASIHCCMWA